MTDSHPTAVCARKRARLYENAAPDSAKGKTRTMLLDAADTIDELCKEIAELRKLSASDARQVMLFQNRAIERDGSYG